MKNVNRKLFGVLMVAAVLSLGLAGCKTRSLAVPGPYSGNVGLYVQDDAISTANRGLHAFLEWELANRALVPLEVSHYADSIRTNLFSWNQRALRLRDAYASTPSDATKLELKGALTELQQALIETTTIIARTKAQPNTAAPAR